MVKYPTISVPLSTPNYNFPKQYYMHFCDEAQMFSSILTSMNCCHVNIVNKSINS